MTKVPTKQEFQPHLGKLFRFAETGHELVLQEVVDGMKLPPEFTHEPFSLIFRQIPRGEVMAEGEHSCKLVDGDQTWTFHIMPIHTHKPEFQNYQVIFG